MAGRRFGAGTHKSPSHTEAARQERREWVRFGGQAHQALGHTGIPLVEVHLDLKPLSRALAELPLHTFDKEVAWAINKGLDKFKAAAHRKLKERTKIRVPSRLKKGVSIKRASVGRYVGTYIINDRNIRITREYFGAHYRPYGRPGANARWGRSFSPAGATWTSWDGTRTGKKTFMIPGRKPAFIRLSKFGGKDAAIRPVFGPNPAEIVRLYAAEFYGILQQAANAELRRQLTRAYKKAEMTVKRKYGL